MDDSVKTKIEQLENNFKKALPQQIVSFLQLWEKATSNPSVLDNWQSLEKEAHRLAGACGMFHCQQLKEDFRRIEQFLTNGAASLPNKETLQKISSIIVKLNIAANLNH